MKNKFSDFRIGVNPFIILHWIYTVVLLTPCLICFMVNPILFSILIVFLISTLIFNKTTLIDISSDLIKIKTNYGLFLTMKKKIVDLSKIERLEISKDVTYYPILKIPFLNSYGVILILRFLTGFYCYKPSGVFHITYRDGSVEEIIVNSDFPKLKKIERSLKSKYTIYIT